MYEFAEWGIQMFSLHRAPQDPHLEMGGGSGAWAPVWLVLNLTASWAQENGGFKAHLGSFLLRKSGVLLRRTLNFTCGNHPRPPPGASSPPKC